ncbi:transcriptional enhancer factor TEF-3 isoform X4 [Ornithorhynchus anatinus]|uniref:transcriptional enhancer factor TEF-3 isoform X4 n=1 Tax=Ornithorhynchus anatinus TaxID=9258 RepID=UPI0010A7CD10|nr:transcriptional enhancer factor TEF-3 isoform X4 [Ornithorhynchus anatinus]
MEHSFQEALAIYPPCGRRKIILSDEGKMYGRNELIARYIKLRTGKTRTRKQVSSHIQVLARRKAREIQAKLKTRPLQTAQPSSPAPFLSQFWPGAFPGQAGSPHNLKLCSQQVFAVPPPPTVSPSGFESPVGPCGSPPTPPWQGRSVAGPKLWMIEFSAFLERQRDPDTYHKHLFVHIGQTCPSDRAPFLEAVDIRQIYDKFPEKKGGLRELYQRGPADAFFLVKFWTEHARYENGHYSYRIHRSPLCEYMTNFIHKLKHLPEKYMMNSVLENFTILQVVTNRDTQETLLCIAYVFEVSSSEHGAQHHIYRLVKD